MNNNLQVILFSCQASMSIAFPMKLKQHAQISLQAEYLPTWNLSLQSTFSYSHFNRFQTAKNTTLNRMISREKSPMLMLGTKIHPNSLLITMLYSQQPGGNFCQILPAIQHAILCIACRLEGSSRSTNVARFFVQTLQQWMTRF